MSDNKLVKTIMDSASLTGLAARIAILLYEQMASIGMMFGGAILNATAFTSGSYLAKYLSGDDGETALVKKKRHDKALEAYQGAYTEYTRDRTKLPDWIETNREIKNKRSRTSRTPITRSNPITRHTQTSQ